MDAYFGSYPMDFYGCPPHITTEAQALAWHGQAHLDVEIKLATNAVNTQRRIDEYATIDYLGNTYDASKGSQDKIVAAIAINGVNDVNWITADNTLATMTGAEFKGLGAALLTRTNVIYMAAQAKKVEMRAVTTMAELEALK